MDALSLAARVAGAPFTNSETQGLLSLPDEVIITIALSILYREKPSAVRDIATIVALDRSCWRLHSICRDTQIQRVFQKEQLAAAALPHFRRGAFTCRQIDMSHFSGVLPAGDNRLIGYMQHHEEECMDCFTITPTTCRAISCTITVIDTKKNTELRTFNLPVASASLHVLGNEQLLWHTPKALGIFNFTTGEEIAQLPLEETGREYVAASPCADGRIAYVTALRSKRWENRFEREEDRLAVWNRETTTTMPLALPPELSRVCAVETYGNIVLAYIGLGKSDRLHVNIFDLVTQQVYSSRDAAVFGQDGVSYFAENGRPAPHWPMRSCVICDHKLVAIDFSREKIYVWNCASGAAAVNTVQINKSTSDLHTLRRPVSLIPSPCEEWVIVLYSDERLEARSLTQLQKVVALREGEERDPGESAHIPVTHIPSSRLQLATPCLAVGRKVLFNTDQGRSLGIWNPQKPDDPITTVSLGSGVLLLRPRHYTGAIMVRDNPMISTPIGTGRQERFPICLPTGNIFSLGNSSILFGCVLPCIYFQENKLFMEDYASQISIYPPVVWDFDVPPPSSSHVSPRNLSH